MARTHFAVAAMLLSFSSVSASSQTLVGYGADTCAGWIEAHRSGNAPDKIALDSWAFGYLDGLAKYIDSEKQLKNLPAADILKGLDRPSVVALTSQFCQANPAQTLDNALAAMTAQLAIDDSRVSGVNRAASSASGPAPLGTNNSGAPITSLNPSVGNTPTATNTPGVNNVPGGLNPNGTPNNPAAATSGLNSQGTPTNPALRPSVVRPTAPGNGTSGVAR